VKTNDRTQILGNSSPPDTKHSQL